MPLAHLDLSEQPDLLEQLDNLARVANKEQQEEPVQRVMLDL